MPRDTRRSGIGLVLAGLAGIAFFIATDARWGLVRGANSTNLVDVINQSSPGTWIGIAGGVIIIVFGLWLIRRRSW
jgi:hypothetical protein